ncbi:MAG: VPS10 domain-containing protein [Gemmatimonas sp.]|jgi:photosystem II stability/assembly factor-like uncharacterized protein|uniref:VPS10 domain-containing protein n=1 Tax=Gemmatimonas sp. TaxID=1962908 RepID=UPI00391FAB3D|nr:dockerin type I domain-containing protein [Gemmatimonadota bacterium]
MRRVVSWAAVLAMFALPIGLALPLGAQSREPLREGDPEERRQALISLWDAVPGSLEPRSGMTYGTWLAAQAGASSALLRDGVPVPVPGRWTSIGPRGFYGDNGFYGSLPQLDAGRVPALAFHPTDRNVLYVGTSAGGLWKSINEGVSWMPLTDTQCSLVIGAVAVDPVNPEIVYAATGEPSESTQGCGVLRSTNGGANWTAYGQNVFTTSLAQGWAVYGLVVDRASAGTTNATTVLAATLRGIMRSTNSGQTWAVVTPALTFSDVVQHPTDPNVMYAARVGVQGSATPPGLWRSADRGATWTTVTTFTADSVSRLEIAVSRARPGSVWIVAGRPDSRFGGLYRFDEATGTRTTLDASGVTAPPLVANRLNFGEQSNYNLMIAVDPSDANVIYVGGVRAYRSRNGGQTFSEIAPSIHVDWHVITVDPNDPTRVFAGNDGGAFLSRDGAESFEAVNAGLATSLHYPGLSVHPTDATGILTGLQDNGTLIARNGMLQWNGVNGGDGAFTAINPENPDVIYVSSQRGNMRRLQASTGTSRSILTGIDANERRAFIAPFVIDPQRSTRLYFGGVRVYRTNNEGTSWTAISGDLTRGSGEIAALAVAPSDTNVIFAGTSDGNVRFTRDHGLTWLAPSTTLPARGVTDFAIDPADPTRVVVTFGSSGTSHVFLSRDGGQTWSDINGALPDVTTQAAVWGPNGRLYVGNMLGVYESGDPGATWSRSEGLPTIRITDLVYNPRTNRLVAATYGRGIWAFDFTTAAPVLRGDVNGDGRVDAADALLIQQGLTGVQLAASVLLFPAGDADCNGKLEIRDALIVVRFAVGETVVGGCVGTRR